MFTQINATEATFPNLHDKVKVVESDNFFYCRNALANQFRSSLDVCHQGLFLGESIFNVLLQ